MAPNLAADKNEWMWVADQDYGESQFKVKQGNTWYAEKGKTGSEANMKRTIVSGDIITIQIIVSPIIFNIFFQVVDINY